MHNLLVPHNMDPIQQNPAGPPNEHTHAHTHTSAVTQRPPPSPKKTDETDTWTAVPEKEKKGKKREMQLSVERSLQNKVRQIESVLYVPCGHTTFYSLIHLLSNSFFV